MSLDDLLKQLQKEYLEEIPSRIEGIQSHVDAKNMDALKEDFHKMKGTGKTYGIPEITELGEKMESLFLACPAQGLSRVNEALAILSRIHDSRTQGQAYMIHEDSRFMEIQKAS
ncbi:MAG TPA: hypothetical protein DCL41_06735 [Bdellovibrionales bacterium]|nr:hypothetical protein [Pseudobdellovibrionaceae bacterium]HAG91548.1 hypothetical protein [Bdellovibrionales bacterium]|tara:strand:- start:8567 stop:8908 length:342 start_codon:yes stop_codon:yes gene_type:complete